MKAVLLFASVAMATTCAAQTPAPPMRMGLWESTTVTKVDMPGMASLMAKLVNKTITARTCYTPDQWEKSIQRQQQEQRKSCNYTNLVVTRNSYAYDMVCTNGKQSGHFQATFDTPESGHGTSHLDLGGSGTADGVATMKFVSADCGNVTPEKPQIIK